MIYVARCVTARGVANDLAPRVGGLWCHVRLRGRCCGDGGRSLQLIFYVDAAGGFRELVKPVQACFGGPVSLAASLFFEREKK